MDLSLLNDKQQDAVISTEGRVRVIAGAGSGKTRVLAYRYAYIVNQLGVNPSHILCLTFTNKAAQEMRKRISQILEEEHIGGYICTIHSFCVKFLREEIYRVGYPRSFQILDTEDLESIIKEVLNDNGITRDVTTVKNTFKTFTAFKKGGNYIEDAIITGAKFDKVESPSLSLQILEKQKKYLTLDFQDLIYFTLYILKNYSDAREKWARQMEYILVDEAQDCSDTQWSIFEILAEQHHNLFVVGDPDQCIYEWRGAMVDFLVKFEADKDIILSRNYRSTNTILDAANSIISNNKIRVKKDLFTLNNSGTRIIHFHGKSEMEESDWISSQIKQSIDNGGKYSDNAVLIRASHLSRSIEQSFIRNDINYVVWGGVRFFERKEVKDLLAYLKLVVYEDDLSFKRIVNIPSRKVGNVAMKSIEDIASASNISLFQAIKVYSLTAPSIKGDTIIQFISLIESSRSLIKTCSISELTENILKDSGLKNYYRDDVDEDRLENLSELVSSIRLYENEHIEDDVTLEDYLQDIALYTNADYGKDSDKVKIMTIHQAKGLEFPNVFIAGLSEGVFPNERSVRERKEKGLEEERRLMYVAVTRAERFLFLTESEGFTPRSFSAKSPSRFIREIKAGLFVSEGNISDDIWAQSDYQKRMLDNYINKRPSTYLPKEGDSVTHPRFGKGIVKSINEDGSFCDVEFFDLHDIRNVSASVLRRYYELSLQTLITEEEQRAIVMDYHQSPNEEEVVPEIPEESFDMPDFLDNHLT